MSIKIIAAVSQNGVIGKSNELPFDYPEDLKHFKKMTTGSVVIMGRKTFEGIGKPLPNRTNVVISSEPIIHAASFVSLKQAIRHYKYHNDVWLIGGRRIYEEGLHYASEIHLTLTPDFIQGTDDELVRFPWINPSFFHLDNIKPLCENSKLEYCIYKNIAKDAKKLSELLFN